MAMKVTAELNFGDGFVGTKCQWRVLALLSGVRTLYSATFSPHSLIQHGRSLLHSYVIHNARTCNVGLQYSVVVSCQ